MSRAASALLALLLGLAPVSAAAQEEAPAPQANAYYGSVGLGFINLDPRGVGIGVPLGLTVALNRLRLLGSLNVFDLAFLEGDDRDPRYVRPVFGSTACVDTNNGFYVPSYYCSGGTDLLRSASADLSYAVFDNVWVAEQPGKLFAGAGYRLADPRTAYATMGLYFDRRSSTAGGAKLSVGDRYVHLGIVWGFNLRRLF